MAVTRHDDLDGTAGAETVTFSLDGQAYEIDLSHENAAAFRGMFRPYLAKSRTVGVVVCLPTAHVRQFAGRMALAEEAGVISHQAVAANGGPTYPEADRSVRPILQLATSAPAVPHQPDHTPPPAELAPEPAPPASPAPATTQAPTPQPTVAKDPEVRDWARRYSIPSVPTRGRVPTRIRSVYEAFHRGDKGPWKTLLKEAGIDPGKAATRARQLTAVDSAKQAPPTQEELDRQAAERVGKLSSAQLTRLRKMYNAPDGRAVSSHKAGDNTSYETLSHRSCCILVATNEEAKTKTYEITNVGRLWFDVRGIDPVDPADT